MNTFNNVIKAIQKSLIAQRALGNALTEFAKEHRTLMPEHFKAIAETIGKHYGCSFAPTKTGYAFYVGEKSTRETRHDGATQYWKNNIAKIIKREPSQSKATDVVTALVNKFNKLSKAEQRKFLASIK